MADFGNYRRDLAVLETSGSRLPAVHHNPPTAIASSNQIAPWMSVESGATGSPNGITSFYNDSSDALSQASQLSPVARPGTAVTGNTNTSDSLADAFFGDGDERRPSVASITTASSTGSKNSLGKAIGGVHKRLASFFGDDPSGVSSSDTSLPSQGKEVRSRSFARSQRDRINSSATDHGHYTGRDASPAGGSRPRTPVPSSEVVPFLYQNSQVSQFDLH